MSEQPISHPIRDALVCGVLLALFAFIAEAITAMRTITSTIEELPLVVDKAIARESAAIRQDFKDAALSVSAEIGGRAERQVAASRETLATEIRVSRTQLLDKVEPLFIRLDAELASTGSATRSLLARYERVPDDAAYATRQIWDCEGNPDCLENRYVSVSRAVEAASRTIQSTTPRMAVALERSAAATASSTEQTNLLIQDARTWIRPLPKRMQSRWVQVPTWVAGKAWPFLLPVLF